MLYTTFTLIKYYWTMLNTYSEHRHKAALEARKYRNWAWHMHVVNGRSPCDNNHFQIKASNNKIMSNT